MDELSPHTQRLLARLVNDEDNLVERKARDAKPDEIRRCLVAFANSVQQGQTAVLFFGVNPRGSVVGVDDSDALQKKVRRISRDDCYPPIELQSFVLSAGDADKRIVAFEIGHCSSRPYFSGPAFVRSGSENITASNDLYRDMLTSHCGKASELIRWKGRAVTVETRGKKLGSAYPPLHDPGYRAKLKCQLRDCTPHYVTFTLLGYGNETCSESLANVEIGWDDTEDRLLVYVCDRIGT